MTHASLAARYLESQLSGDRQAALRQVEEDALGKEMPVGQVEVEVEADRV
jgi:hypothetical protein